MGPDLIDRAKRGDREAFTTLILQFGDRLYSVAFRILRAPDEPRTRSSKPS